MSKPVVFIVKLQEGHTEGVMATVEVLLDTQTLYSLQPHLSDCYLRPGTLVKYMYEQTSLPVTAITTVTTKPRSVVDWNPTTCRLENVLSKVL